MRNILLVIIYLTLGTFTSHAYSSGGTSFSSSDSKGLFESSQNEFLKVDEAFKFRSSPTDNGLKLSWEIADGYYLYKERFKFRLVDKSLEPLVKLGPPEFSSQGKPKQDDYFGLVHAFYKHVEIVLPIDVDASLSDVEIKISSQGCADAGLCYPPKHEKVLYVAQKSNSDTTSNKLQAPNQQQTPSSQESPDFENAAGVFSFIQNSSLLAIVGIFFLLGIGLTFTPCVFPMIPIITSIIAGQQKPTVGKSFMLSLAYVIGMAATYAAAGVVTGLLGAGANVQAALQDPIVLSVFSAIFILLALAMFGLYELQLPAFLRDRLNTTSQNLNGGHITSVFFIGALSALIVSPCVSAPLAGALLYISSTADAVIGGLSLFALGLGMGVPLILIAIGGGKFFPKAGAWMDKVKYAFGIMLIAVAIWLISRVIPESVSLFLWALLCGLTASQMGAFDAAKPGIERVSKGLGLLLALYAALLFIGSLTQATNPLNPLETLISNQQTNTQKPNKLPFNTIYSNTGLEQHLAIAKQNGQALLVDFYADWCISCKVMENEVFPLVNIDSKLRQFYLVKADVTDNTDENKALLERFGLFGPPSILLFDKKGKEIKDLRIVGEISANGFDQHLGQALVRQ